jgi:hypothetical protein
MDERDRPAEIDVEFSAGVSDDAPQDIEVTDAMVAAGMALFPFFEVSCVDAERLLAEVFREMCQAQRST